MIRTSFAALSALLIAAAPIRAQGLEFSGGVNFSKLNGAAIQSAAQNVGLILGLDLVIPVGPVGLNLGADWSQKGVEQEALATVIDLSYIELPVHLRVPLVGAGPVRLNLIAGPTLGINTGCEVSVSSGTAEECADLAQNPFEAEKLEWAGTGGVGLSFRVGGLAYAGLDLKYSFGLSNVSEGSALDAKNRTFTLSSHVGLDVF